MFKLLKIAAFALIVPVVALSGPTMVAAAGQIEGGNFYRAKNVSKGGSYGDPITADKCETVQFLAQIHNPGPEPLTGVNVRATLPTAAAASISSTATINSPVANPNSMSDTVTINMPGANKISYLAGSTKLLNANSGVIQNLPDGITGGGVSVPGGVGVSLQQIRYVQFQAKIDCPDKPVPPTPVTPETPENPKTSEAPAPAGQAPATIAATGPEAIASGIAGSSALGYGIRRWLMSKAALKAALNQ